MTFSWKAVALLLVPLCAAPASPASDLRGTRIESLRGDLQSLRRRAERAPRASVFELKQLQRRLAEHLVGVAAGTLDDTDWIVPKLHVWARSAQGWLQFPDGVEILQQSNFGHAT